MVKLKSFFILFLTVFFLSNHEISHAQQGSVAVNQDSEIAQLLELKKDINKEKKNYKIQIFNGSHSGALKAQEDFKKAFRSWSIDMEYETPNYKIWVGNFKSRLEADRALLEVKKEFANAFIFKPKRDKKEK